MRTPTNYIDLIVSLTGVTTEELQQEEWRPVAEFPRYEVSSLGRLWDTKRNAIVRRSLGPGRRGEPVMVPIVCYPGKYTRKSVRRLMLLAFRGPPPHEGSRAYAIDRKAFDVPDTRLANSRWSRPGDGE